MTHEEREKWLASLKTGDQVALVEAPAGHPDPKRLICLVTVTRLPSSRLYLGDDRRLNWSNGFRNDSGADPRALVPKESTS